MRLHVILATCFALSPRFSGASSAASNLAMASAPVRRQESGLVSSSSIFLRRAYHASAVLDGWLYIDGGEFAYSDSNGKKYRYSTTLLAVDLSKDFTTESVQIHEIEKPSEAPSLRHGGLWVDESKKLLYTGFAGRESLFEGQYDPNGLWSFAPDGSGSGTWANLNGSAPAFKDDPRRWNGQAAWGHGKGYYLGGFGGNNSATNTKEDPINGMLVYDFATNDLKTNEISQVSTAGSVQRGAMVYVPNFGSEGVLVSVGGIQRSKRLTNIDYLIPMATAQIYDPVKQTWYEQTTTGSAPPARKDYCMAGAASSNRTYEILVYAGWGGDLGDVSVSWDVAYVLSLPSFRWFKADYTALSPRHGVTCNSIGGGKIMTVGGADTQQNNNNYPYGLYAHVFDSVDNFNKGLGVFDLSTMSFKHSYSTSDQGPYTLNPEIQSYYDRNGRMPTFDKAEIADLFSVENFTTQPQTEGNQSSSQPGVVSESPSSTNLGAIIGGVVGGVAVIALIAGAVFFFLRKRQRSGASEASPFAASTAYFSVAGGSAGGPGHQQQLYQQQPYQQSAPSELPSHYGSGGNWTPELNGYYGGGGFDRRSISTEAKYQDAHVSSVYYPQDPVELQTHHYDVPAVGFKSASPPPQPQSATLRVHEVHGHQDGPAPEAEDNYKYNVRF